MRDIKFRAFIDGEMIGADSLAFEEYGTLTDQLASCEHLMQFTGLPSKNTDNLCQGDRVKLWNGNKTFIGHDGFQFTVGKSGRPMKANEAQDMEVIGHIYED